MNASVRVLVFGGSGFIEHLRLGDWPTFPSGMLSDAYGLGAGALSVGIGVRDNRPFIIYRESQQHRDRTYPYWLLLDPGEILWQRFRWNGPSIITALSRTSLWERLRKRPEHVDANDTREILDTLECKGLPSSSFEANSFGAFIVGAAAQEPGISICSPAAVADCRVESLDDLARVFEDLPPAFRIAKGWLMSGAAAHAKELGCAAVVDPRSSHDAGTHVIGTGRALLESVHVIEESAYSHALNTLFSEPLFRWPLDTLELLNAFGNLLSGNEGKVNWMGIDFERLPSGVAYDFVQASLSVPGQTGTFSSGRTQFLIARMLAGDLPQNADLATWDLRTVSVSLANKSVSFDRFIAKAGLSANLSLDLWRHYCCDATESDVLSALGALVPVLDEPTLDRFTDVALQRMPSSTSLHGWSALSLPSAVSTKVLLALREQAISRTIARQPGWETDFILYAADATATTSRTSLPNQDIKALVTAALDMTGPSVRQPATEFLSTLARAPFRAPVPLGLKRAVAARAPVAWSDFCILLDLWDGRALTGNRGRELNRAALFSELGDLIREYREGGELPNLSGLVDLLGSQWPADIVAELKQCRPFPTTIPNARSWLDGWRILDPDWAHSEETRIRRVIIGHILDNPDGMWSFEDLRKFSKAEIAQCAAEYLGTVTAPEEVRHRAINVLRLAERHAPARAAFDSFLQGQSQLDESLFVEVMFHDRNLLATAASIASPRSLNDLLDAMVKADQNAFSEVVIDCLVRSAREPNVRPIASRLASYVQANQPSVVRRMTRSMFGGNAAECRAALERLKRVRS